MVVSASGTFVGTKINPAVRIIHLYEQTKWGVQLQAMLSRKVNAELLVSRSLLMVLILSVPEVIERVDDNIKQRLSFGVCVFSN